MARHKLNQPCPCGSGRKYKKCCFLIDVGAGANTTSNNANIDDENENDDDLRDAADHPACRPAGGDCSADERAPPGSSCCYRFRVGDRVEARWRRRFHPGTIVALDYEEPGWLGGVPYQIKLDGKYPHYIYAPFDDDACIRALTPAATKTAVATPTKRRRPAGAVASMQYGCLAGADACKKDQRF